MSSRVCSFTGPPSCPVILTDGSTRCGAHSARKPDPRPSASARGYDVKWRRNAARFLKAHPLCVDCSAPATAADHDPVERRVLVALGDPHPDAWHHLRPRCTPCHNRRTASTSRRGVGVPNEDR